MDFGGSHPGRLSVFPLDGQWRDEFRVTHRSQSDMDGALVRETDRQDAGPV